MKILHISAYYAPEQYAELHLIKDLCTTFEKSEIETEMYVPTPTRGVDKETRRKYKKIKYEEQYNGTLKIHRFSLMKEGKNPVLRALRYLLSNLIQYHKGKKAKDIDLVFGSSTPPTQGVLCAKVAQKLSKKYKRKVPFVYNLQDVFPDSLVYTGLAKKDSLLWKIGRKIEDYTYRHADKIIVISESMRDNILAKGVPEEKIVVVPNWVDVNDIQPVERKDNKLIEEYGIDSNKFLVVYAGNFGEAQGADVVIRAAETLQEQEDVQFVIFGGGAKFAQAEERAKSLKNVIINPLLPADRISEVYSLGNVALITCKKGAGTSGMPSKTWSIMACNTPIIASFDKESELAKILVNENAGIVVEPENETELAQAILKIKEQGFECRSREYVSKNASKEVCTQKYIDVIKEARR